RFAADHRAYIVGALDLAALLRPSLSDGSAQRYIRVISTSPPATPAGNTSSATTEPTEVPFDGSFALRVTPPMPDTCRLIVTVRPAAEMVGRSIRWMGRDRDELPPPRPAIVLHTHQSFVVALERDAKHPIAER